MRSTQLVIAAIALASTAACTKEDCAPVDSSAEAPPPLAVTAFATTRQVMLGITIPTSDALFQIGMQPPADDVAWEKMQANAIALAESGNLLKIEGRLVDRQEWLQYSDALIESAKAAASAAQEKNVEKVLEAGNQIYEVCDACHNKYIAARAGV